VPGNAEHPRLERSGTSERVEAIEGRQEDILHDVIHEIFMGLQATSDIAIDGVGVRRDESGGRFPVLPQDGSHKLLVVSGSG
jgi:hypothetical protein